MALHVDLPIHRTGVSLLSLAFKVQEQMPRQVKRTLGEKVTVHCVEMLDLMALANATRHAERAGHLHELLKHQRALHDRARLANAARRRGHCVNGALTKAY